MKPRRSTIALMNWVGLDCNFSQMIPIGRLQFRACKKISKTSFVVLGFRFFKQSLLVGTSVTSALPAIENKSIKRL